MALGVPILKHFRVHGSECFVKLNLLRIKCPTSKMEKFITEMIRLNLLNASVALHFTKRGHPKVHLTSYCQTPLINSIKVGGYTGKGSTSSILPPFTEGVNS